jgi:predicted DNA-binding antitoxin AbrB/MazE fold protein
MVQITEAIFSGGVLKPVGDMALAEGQRVRLVVEPIDGGSSADTPSSRPSALKKLLAGIEESSPAPCLPGTSCMTAFDTNVQSVPNLLSELVNC